MKLEGITEKLTNLEIAHRQLERSIELFLDRGDYISALTLAGAAEEILGKLLKKEGKSHWLDEITSGALGLLGFEGAALESPEAKKAGKEIADIANYYKNRCKHFNDHDHITFTVDVKAAEMIDRAISNYWDLTQRETGAMGRFKDLILFQNKNA
jgi:superfamily II DNA or RNA helicase